MTIPVCQFDKRVDSLAGQRRSVRWVPAAFGRRPGRRL